MHDDVQDAPDHAPGVVHVQVDLGPELHGFELLRAQDDVPGAVLDTVPVTQGYTAVHVDDDDLPGDVSKLEVVRPSEDALDRPLGQLARVVLQLRGQTSSTLRVKLLSPVNLRRM